MTDLILKVKNGDVVGATNSFLRELLESGKMHSLLVPQEVPSGKAAFPVMISDPKKLNANIFAPVLPASTATILSRITRIKGTDELLGVVLRGCQARALIELVKLKQADLNNIVLIGVDCLGTFPINTYSDFPEKNTPTEYLLSGEDAERYMRSACIVCKEPVPPNTDIVIGLFGMDMKKELLIRINSEAGEELVKGMNLSEKKDMGKREKGVKDVHDEKDRLRAAFLKEKSSIKGMDRIVEFFDTCVNCHNCMKACPVCYCKECLFESSVFDLEANKFVSKADRKGLYKMPNDSLLFHITRMNHMILSCVECGLCEQACPNNIPLMDVFIPAAENAQAEFEYLPGRDPEEQLPLVVYREDEYQEVGER